MPQSNAPSIGANLSRSRFPALLAAGALGQYFLSQSNSPWTLGPGLVFYALAFWLLSNDNKLNPQAPLNPPLDNLSPKSEFLLFILIFLLALFFRLYRLDSLPAGMHTDQGLMGEYGLWVQKGWRPFLDVLGYQVPEVLLGYLLAGWYGLFGASYISYHAFFIALAMAAFPFIYWTFRQWAGPRTALFSLFVLAVMRWNWTEPRVGYPSSEVGFFLFAGLAFWLHWVRTRWNPSLYLSAIWVGLGLYTYQIFKAVPFLCLIYATYELRHGFKKPKRLALWAGIILAFALPLLSYFALNHTAGNREGILFIGQTLESQHSLKPLWDEVASNLLMFNRQGDPNPRHNLPGLRMLDDVTGFCFILGLGLAWLRRKERMGFYPLAGFLLFMGVAFLTNDPANSNRLWVLSVFAAYFAGSTLENFRSKLKPGWRVRGMGILLLSAMAFQNARIYFVQIDRDPQCRGSYGSEQSYIGRTVENMEKTYPGRYRFFIPPLYTQNHTVKFLTDACGAAVTPLQIDDLASGRMPKDKDMVFFMEEGKAGVAEFLRALFPGGKDDSLEDTNRQILVYRYEAPREVLNSFKKWDRGIQGTYWNSTGPAGIPVTVKWDPLLNFSNKLDFPFQSGPPFFIRWKGTLNLSVAGAYSFEALTMDGASVWVDEKLCFESGKSSQDKVRLGQGPHSLRVEYHKTSGDWMALHLIWMRPGATGWEVVPAAAFGKIK